MKLESNFKNMFLVLLIIAILAAGLLASVYSITKDRIAKSLEEKKLKAITEVILSGNDNDPLKDFFPLTNSAGDELQCYPAKKGETITSVAIKTFTNKGFSGYISLMVGFLPDGTINKINVLEQKETPGLGTKMDTPKFKSQFEGKNPANFKLKVKKDGGDIDAITAATITSRAFCDAVERAYEAYMRSKK